MNTLKKYSFALIFSASITQGYALVWNELGFLWWIGMIIGPCTVGVLIAEAVDL